MQYKTCLTRRNYLIFDCESDPANVGPRWKRWLTAFEIFADSKGLIIEDGSDKHKQRRRALLLHNAGTSVQDIFHTLPDVGDVKDYEGAVQALTTFFMPSKNATYARHVFRNLHQLETETVIQYATRLRKHVRDCEYGQDEENQIRDQILLLTYLLAYRSMPHNTTGISPAELLFGRKLRTKIPELHEREFTPCQEVRDHDAEQKSKAKAYADEARGATPPNVTIGDKVLVKQDRSNKLDTPFSPVPLTVVDKTGSMVIVQNQEGVKYSRNTAHVKKLFLSAGESVSSDSMQDQPQISKEISVEQKEESSVGQGQEISAEPGEEGSEGPNLLVRPKRTVQMPRRFDDFVLSK